MALDKLLPGRLPRHVWLRIKAIFNEDILDGCLPDLVSKVNYIVLDPGVAPAWILGLEPNYEIIPIQTTTFIRDGKRFFEDKELSEISFCTLRDLRSSNYWW